jgi:hypothetical protein
MGSKQPASYPEHMLLICLIHDCLGWSFTKIKSQVAFGKPIGNTSIQANIKRVRRVLGEWSRSLIVLGTKRNWDAAMKDVARSHFLSPVRLWLDSSDIDIEKQRGRGRKSEHWSGKNNHPARRYMALVDGDTIVRRVWGGYSPKVYDGHFVELEKDWFDNTFNDVGIVADSHFHSVKRQLRHAKIFAPKPEQTAYDSNTKQGFSKLTAEQQKQNAAIRTLRARVEQVFSSLSDTMTILKRPWAEDLNELDDVVFMGFAVHNFKKQRLE